MISGKCCRDGFRSLQQGEAEHLPHVFARLPIDAEHCLKQKQIKKSSRNEGAKNNHCTRVLLHLLGLSVLIFPCQRKNPCAEAPKAEHATRSLSLDLNPSLERGGSCWSLFCCFMGFWWNTIPWGKSLLSPDPHWGPLWTFHHIKIDLPQTTCTISPSADKVLQHVRPRYQCPS